MNKKFLLALTTVQLVSSTFAHADWIRYQNYKVQFNLPAQWKVVTDLYGMPITVLGPDRGGERAVLSVQHTAVRNYTFDQKEVAGEQNDYFNGRKVWLEKQEQGKFISKIPYQQLYAGTQLNGFEIGYRYKIHGNQFEERSAQVNCGGRLYLIKTLAGDKTTADDRATLAKFVNQFQCATVTAKDGPYVPGPLHPIQDYIQQQNAQVWPTTHDFKNASTAQKAKALAALVEFYERYDVASEDDSASASTSSPKTNSNFAFLKSQLLRLIPGANADDDYNCFFGGWPSKYTQLNGHTTCDYPATANSNYPAAACTGQLACNPSLFGDGLCVDDNTPALRAHATLACEMKFQQSGKTYDSVVSDPKFDVGLLNSTFDSAKKVCTTNNYAASNYGLCHTLETKLQASVQSGKSTDDPGYIQSLDALKRPAFDNDLGTLAANYKNFEDQCLDAQSNFKTGDADCATKLKDITADFERVEKTEAQASLQTNDDSSTNNTNCIGGTCGAPKTADTTVPPADTTGGSCTPDETAQIKSAVCPWSPGGSWTGTGSSCTKNLIHALINDLSGTVTAIPSLVTSAVKSGYHALMGLFSSEDQTASKAQQASGTSDSLLKQMTAHPVDTTIATAESILKATFSTIFAFMQNDVFCQVWTGTPHTSTCSLPGNLSCLSCMTKLNGACSIAGYVIAEVVPSLLTGGVAGIAKDGVVGAKIAAFLGKASKEGELLKYSTEIESKIPEIAKGAKAAEGTDFAEQAVAATAKAAKVSKIKSVANALKSFKAGFTSRLGTFDETLSKLGKFYTMPKNTVMWTAKKAGQAVSIPYKPYELAYQLGFKTGERITDRAFVNVMKAEAAVHEGEAISKTAMVGSSAVEEAKTDAKAAKAAKTAKATAKDGAETATDPVKKVGGRKKSAAPVTDGTAAVTPPATTAGTTAASAANDGESVVTKTRTKTKIVKDEAEVIPAAKGKGRKIVTSETVTETNTETVSKKKGSPKNTDGTGDGSVATSGAPETTTAPTDPTTPTKTGKGKGKPKSNPVAGTSGDPTTPLQPNPTGPATPGGGPARTDPIRIGNAETVGNIPGNFAFPEANRIKVKTDLYSAQLKTLENYQFDKNSLGAEAKEVFQKQKDLLAETQKMQGAGSAKPLTAQARLDNLKQVQDSQKNFSQMEKNNKEIMKYITKDGGKVALPTTAYAYSSRYKYLLHLQRARLVTVGGSASGDLAAMNVYGMNNAQIEAAAKASNITVAAYKANYLDQKKNNDDLAVVSAMTQKLSTGKTLTAEDIKKLPDGVTVDQLQNHLSEMQAEASASSNTTAREPSGSETAPEAETAQ